MKVLKIEKGSFKYINNKRIIEIIKTVFMFSCAIFLYLFGYITLKTNKNFFTVFAVLSVLPAAKSAVSMIMFLRFSSIDEEDYKKIKEASGNANTKYEYVFTTSERAFFVKAISILNNTIICLYAPKKKDFSKELKEHIVTCLEREGYKSYSVKVYISTDDYIKRLTEMNEKLSGDETDSSNNVFSLFNAVSI